MKFSDAWLRTFVDPPQRGADLAHLITMAGIEVESVEDLQAQFQGVVVARVLSTRPHPNADRLKVCEVDAGPGAPLEIVCGAPNVTEGAMVPCAKVGAILPGLTIKQAAVRGVVSNGMLCSQKELGLSEDASGLMILPNDAPVGAKLSDYLQLDDLCYTLKVTPNRGDCLSLTGIARELAAITNTPMRDVTASAVTPTLTATRTITLENKSGCPRYCGRVIELTNAAAPTPAWMRQRLERSGLRCVSAVVDVTNYVMLELGQPLHAFDLDKLQGGITVRSGRVGEKLRLLNGQEIEICDHHLLIADESGPVALAGVMGGGNSEVSDSTRRVFLEAAYFSPEAVAGRARSLGLTSDAAMRFERGVDFMITQTAMERATQLILEICGGTCGPVSMAAAEIPARKPVRVRPARVNAVLGTALAQSEIASVFDRLRFDYEKAADGFVVRPPSFRFDLAIEADFHEEVARLIGYDNVPATMPRAVSVMLPVTDTKVAADRLRALLVDRDYQEVITYSFIEEQLEHDVEPSATPIRLLNPIASHMNVMRSSLLPGLVQVLRHNLNYKHERVRIFELGRVFSEPRSAAQAGRPRYSQPLHIAGLCAGSALPEQWGTPNRAVDLFDAKADVEALLGHGPLDFARAVHPALHPGRSSTVQFDGRSVGWLGELHPRLQQKWELSAAPIVFELELEYVQHSTLASYVDAGRFPPVRRDLAFLVEDGVSVGDVLRTLRQAAPATVTQIELFDLYRGEGVPKGKKSLAFRIVMRDTEKTLAEQDIEEIRFGLVQTLQTQYNAQTRG